MVAGALGPPGCGCQRSATVAPPAAGAAPRVSRGAAPAAASAAWGSDAVALRLAGGGRRSVAVRDGGYSALARDPRAVTYRLRGVAVSVALGPPRAAVPHGPAPGGG